MRYNKLGSTGLFISELCLGTMTFGGTGAFAVMGSVQQTEADALVGRALEAGVNIIDTADTYSGGESERITGRALKNLDVARDEVLIATKVFGDMGTGPNKRGSSRSHIISAAKASLERLQTDYIDLYWLHGFDPATPIEETLDALTDLVRQGHVRYIGVSNWAAWQISKALGIAALHHFARFASLQAYYSIASRDLERDIIPMLASENLGLLVWSPLAGGLLSGTVSREKTSEAGTRRSTLAFPPVDPERAYTIIDALKALAEIKAVSVARVAIAWLLHQSRVSSVVIGAKRVEQLDDNLGAVDVRLDDDDLRALDAVSAIPAEYPGWMLGLWGKARADQLAQARSAFVA